MSDGSPVASILMAAYNAEATVEAAVASAQAQTERAIEILVTDDGSTDATAEIVARMAADDPRIRLFRVANGGKARALNAMLDEARGRYAAVLDADDLAAPERVAVAAARLDADPSLGGVLTGHELLIEIGGRWRRVAPRATEKSRARCAAEIAEMRMPAHDPTLVVGTAIAQKLRFAEDLRIGEGVDFVFRLAEAHGVEVIGQALYAYRVTPGSLTKTDPEARRAQLSRLAERTRERRGLGPMPAAEFEARFGEGAASADNNLAAQFVDSAFLQVEAGQRSGAIDTAITAVRLFGASGATLRCLVYALSPRAVARRFRAKGRGALAQESGG